MKSIKSIEVLTPVLTERFALKVIFDLGEVNNKKVGLITIDNKVILEPIYHSIDFEDGNRIICRRGNDLGCEVMEYCIKA
ncbi:MAG: hypothetical protein R3Y46_07395 [Opitutales bacterium]